MRTTTKTVRVAVRDKRVTEAIQRAVARLGGEPSRDVNGDFGVLDPERIDELAVSADPSGGDGHATVSFTMDDCVVTVTDNEYVCASSPSPAKG
jgi:hypothetical protein